MTTKPPQHLTIEDPNTGASNFGVVTMGLVAAGAELTACRADLGWSVTKIAGVPITDLISRPFTPDLIRKLSFEIAYKSALGHYHWLRSKGQTGFDQQAFRYYLNTMLEQEI